MIRATRFIGAIIMTCALWRCYHAGGGSLLPHNTQPESAMNAFEQAVELPQTSAGPAAQLVTIPYAYGALDDSSDLTLNGNLVYRSGKYLTVPPAPGYSQSGLFDAASPAIGSTVTLGGESTDTTVTHSIGTAWSVSTTTQTIPLPAFSYVFSLDGVGDYAGAASVAPCSGVVANEAIVEYMGAVKKPLAPPPCVQGVGGSVAYGMRRQQDGSVATILRLEGSNFAETHYYYTLPAGTKVVVPAYYVSAPNKYATTAGSQENESGVPSVFQISGGVVHQRDLPAVAGTAIAGALTSRAVNDYNEIVGRAPNGHLVMWLPQTISGSGPETYIEKDLSALLPASTIVGADINNHDQIAANPSGIFGGNGRTYLLSLYRQAVDVSSGSGVLQAADFTKLLNTGPYWNLLITRLFGGVSIDTSAYQTLVNAAQSGMPGAGYVLLDFRVNSTTHRLKSGTYQMQQALRALCPKQASCINPTTFACSGVCVNPRSLYFIAIDVEAGLLGTSSPTQRQWIINQAVAAAPPVPIVVYTKKLVWTSVYFGAWGNNSASTNPYSKCPLWDIVYDNVDALNQTTLTGGFGPRALYGGWATRFAKQYEQDPGPGLPGKGPDVGALETYLWGANTTRTIDLDTSTWNLPATVCKGGSPPKTSS